MKNILSLSLILCSFLHVNVKANVYTVTSSTDGTTVDGVSLRWAITQANSNTGRDTIMFDISPYNKVHVIDIQTVLPILTDMAGVFINGYSQSGALPNTLDISQGNNAQPKIQITTTNDISPAIDIQSDYNIILGLNIYDMGSTSMISAWKGIQVGGGFSAPARNNQILGCWIGIDSTGKIASTNQDIGISLYYGDNTMIGNGTNEGMNVISGNNEDGIQIGFSADSNMIRTNIIGLDINGYDRPISALQLNGVNLESSGDNNIIGGNIVSHGNVISGNKNNGINIRTFSTSNKIYSNIIGPAVNGVSKIDSQKTGISIHVQGLAVGKPNGGNVIAGNNQDGIYIYDDGLAMGTYNLKIQSNYIGISSDGITPVPNKRHGLFINGNSAPYGIANNIIGGSNPDATNLIANNDSVGIKIYGTFTIVNRNSIRQNNIYSNGLKDILLTNNANDGILPPNITSAIAFKDSLIVNINGATISDTLELFIETSTGSIFYTSVLANSTSLQVKTLMPSMAEANSTIRITATDTLGNTSEFSNAQNITFYSLTGIVYEGSTAATINAGTVLLWKYDTIAAPFDSVVSASIISGGVYKFTDIVVPGDYLIFAIPDSNTNPNALRTYFGDVSRWFEAQKISIFTTTLNKDIICKVKAPAIGSNTIQGRVEEGQGFGKVQGPGDPFNGIDVSLIDKSTGSAIAQTTTDNDTTVGVGGTFSFDNVADGEYLIHVEIAGVPIDTNVLFVVNAGQPVVNNVTAIVDSNYISFNVASSVKKIEPNILGVAIYPNPVIDIIYLSFDLKESSKIKLSIVDNLGRTVATIVEGKYDKGSYSFNKDISSLDLANGIYFAKLLINDKVLNAKFIYTKR